MLKRRHFFLVIVGIAVVIAATVLAHCSRDELTVHLIDEDRGKRVTNVNVTIVEFFRIPLISSWHFLPLRLRESVTVRKFHCVDGTFRVGRMSERGARFMTSLAFEGPQIQPCTYSYENCELHPSLPVFDPEVAHPLHTWNADPIKIPDSTRTVMIRLASKTGS
jgi:hypothetical protein